MIVGPFAGKPATPAMLVNVPALVTAYYTGQPDSAVPAQRVAFGTSGHRGSALEALRASTTHRHDYRID
jgi:phosphoglucomutase